jgi:hypothetical protein
MGRNPNRAGMGGKPGVGFSILNPEEKETAKKETAKKETAP